MKPLYTKTLGDLSLEVFYEFDHHRFKLAMWRGGECRMIQYVPATYEPVFGIDEQDVFAIGVQAEEMEKEIR